MASRLLLQGTRLNTSLWVEFMTLADRRQILVPFAPSTLNEKPGRSQHSLTPRGLGAQQTTDTLLVQPNIGLDHYLGPTLAFGLKKAPEFGRRLRHDFGALPAELFTHFG